jgi:hypothetical protein
MEEMFSLRSMLGLYNEDWWFSFQLRVAVVESEKLLAEVGDSSATQRKGNVYHWKPLVKTEKTSCVL